MSEHDELLARLDKYGSQREKLAERLKDRMEPEWNHFIDAAAAIRSLQAQLEAERGARARMEKKYCEEVGIIWSEEWSKKWWG